MDSIFNRLLIAMQDKILTDIPDSPETPGIRYVDQYLGQIDFYETRPAITFPAILIDFASTNYQQKQGHAQWAEMQITARLCFDPYSNSSSITPQTTREKALFYYEIENKLYKSLQHQKFNLLMLPMIRVSAVSEKREDPFRVRVITFKATYEDKALPVAP